MLPLHYFSCWVKRRVSVFCPSLHSHISTSLWVLIWSQQWKFSIWFTHWSREKIPIYTIISQGNQELASIFKHLLVSLNFTINNLFSELNWGQYFACHGPSLGSVTFSTRTRRLSGSLTSSSVHTHGHQCTSRPSSFCTEPARSS